MICMILFIGLLSSSLFMPFFIFELLIFFFGAVQLYKCYRSISDIKNAGEILKHLLENKESEINNTVQQNNTNTKNANNLILSLFNLFSKSKEGELGVDRDNVDRLLTFELNKRYSFVKTSINILPVVGLIGTFIGISIAVYQLSFSSDLSQIFKTIEKNLASLNPFLDGIKLAFYTTVVALILALILRISSEFVISLSKNAIMAFQNYFSTELMEYIRPVGPADKIAKSVTLFSKRVSKLSNDIESSLNQIVENYSKNSQNQVRQFDERIKSLTDIQDNIITNLSYLWNNITASLNTSSEQIGKACDNYREISEKSLELMEHFSNLVGQVQEVTSTQIDNTEKIEHAVRNLSEDNQKIVEQISNFISPLENLRLKYESVLNKSVELNEPFKATNLQLKTNFENLVKSINELQIKNTSLMEELNTYASSLESNVGTKLDNIAESEEKRKLFLESIDMLLRKMDKSVENLSSYSIDLKNASRLLVESINDQLNNLFIDLSQRQNIAINISDTGMQTYKGIEGAISKQNEIFNNVVSMLINLESVLNNVSKSLIKPPFFSLRRWFGDHTNEKHQNYSVVISADKLNSYKVDKD
ncbi:MAG: hypothetical protein FJW56_00410 [Actinobacteria bacterium]|nr:hypothetical protein [Actinomycetota bacterium]